jgi:polyisoprenoid-binding protein YceI
MRNLKRSALAASLLLFALSPSRARASTWEIDPSHSAIEFSIRHMMVSTVKGVFEKFKGTVDLDDKDISKSSVQVTIETASISTRDAKRDEHLKSADFFDVAKYPTATFKSTKVEKAGKNKLKVTGELTLHGASKPIVLEVDGLTEPAKTPFGTTVRGAHATTKLDRKDFGLGWNKVLDNGGVLVGNEVTLELNVELVEKAPAAAAKK